MSFASSLSDFVAAYGLPALFASVGLETMGLPLPGETAIIVSSGLAAKGDGDVYAVAATAFLASVLGDNVAYVIGRRFGRPFIVRHGSRVGITDARFAKVEAQLRRRGPALVVFARFFVVLRQLNGLVAGAAGMRWPVFVAANIVGAGLWVGVWTTVGYRFGKSAEFVPFILHHLALVMMIVVPLLLIVLIVAYYRR